MPYSSLHNHSYYSFLDGYSSPKEMLDRAKEVGIKCIAYTDHGNQFAYPVFDALKKDYPDIKVLSGCEMYEAFDMYNKEDSTNKYFHLLFISRNNKGRIALNKLISKSWMEGFYYKNRIDLKSIEETIGEDTDNLIVCSACLASKIAREDNYEKCVEYVNEYKAIFPHFYLEMQSHRVAEQEQYNKKILHLSNDTNTPFIITTDSHYSKLEDAEAQFVHVAIGRKSSSVAAEEINETYKDCYIQSEEDIHNIMDSQIGKENVDIGLSNTNEIADICESTSLPYGKPELPLFPIPAPYKDNYEYLKYQIKVGWKNRGLDKLTKEKQEVYKQRIDYELGIIHQMGFDGYFLVEQEALDWCRKNDIELGSGRGSGAGSEVNYVLGITQIDAIKFGLLFERFLNPERSSMPDIDTDIDDRRKLIVHLTEKYGKDYVCQVANISYITNVVAIKDVARVLNIPYKISEEVSKRFIYEKWEDCINNCKDIIEKHPEYNNWFSYASKEVGRALQKGIHAGGVCVGRKPIYNYTSLFKGSEGEQVAELTKHYIESVSLIKYDFLGLSNLSVVKNTCKYAHISKQEISIDNPTFFNDKNMYKVLQEGDTDNVFQMESSGMTELSKKLYPECINDVSALLALYRPSSMKFLSDYIEFKHHPETVTYWHPDLEECLKETYGLAIYQESILSIVRKMGGYSYGQADMIRRACGKKDVELAKQEAAKLNVAIVKNGYTQELADQISQLVVESAGYSFNHSHSFSYAVLTLQTAWLKYYYPTEFYCAVLNNDINDYGRINWDIICLKKHDVEITHPSINESQNDFSVVNGKILFGLSGIKGVGNKLSEQIVQERNINGKFKNFDDFISRIDLNVKQLVMLVKAGAIPCNNKRDFLIKYAKHLFNCNPYKPVKTLPTSKVLKEKWGIDKDIITDKEERLKLYNEQKKSIYENKLRTKFNQFMDEFAKKYLQDEDIWEFEALSIFITNNPFIDSYKFIHKKPDEVENGEKGVMVGVVSNVERKKSKKSGNPYAFVSVYGCNGSIELTAWTKQLLSYEKLIKRGSQVSILFKKNDDKYVIEEMRPYQEWLTEAKTRQNNKGEN